MEVLPASPFRRSWLRLALAWLCIVALLGIFLRLLFIYPVPGVNFRYFVHAHSHTALLGWVHSALFIILIGIFLPENVRESRKYKIQFWLTQLAVAGMLCSFPVQGYAAVSISFSSLHIFVSWWFAWSFYRDSRKYKDQNALPLRFAWAGLFFMVFSAIGPFSLGPMMVNGMGGSKWYYLAIYFYLHFEYNGWFTFAILGIFFWWLDQKKIIYSAGKAQLFYRLMFWACIPGYLLSTLWAKPPGFIYIIAAIAAIMQMAALNILWQMIMKEREKIKFQFQGMAWPLLKLSAAAFTLKISMQLVSALPYFADLSYSIRNFIIGYLHLTLLGFATLFLFAFFIVNKSWEAQSGASRNAIWMFLAGFILSEILLFLQSCIAWAGGTPIQGFDMYLFIVSLLMPAGLIWFFVSQRERVV